MEVRYLLKPDGAGEYGKKLCRLELLRRHGGDLSKPGPDNGAQLIQLQKLGEEVGAAAKLRFVLGRVKRNTWEAFLQPSCCWTELLKHSLLLQEEGLRVRSWRLRRGKAGGAG